MATITPYLTMEGNAREAIAFYERVLDANVLSLVTFGEVPENPEFPVPDEIKSRITHAHLEIGGTPIMMSDCYPGQEIASGNRINLCLTPKTIEESSRLFDALSDGGQVVMPLMETFFSPGFGQLIDPFGVGFLISTEPKE